MRKPFVIVGARWRRVGFRPMRVRSAGSRMRDVDVNIEP